VLDFGTAMPRRLRGHTWPRLMHAAEHAHTAVVVLAPQRVAGSFSTLSLAVQARTTRWQPGAWPLFEGFDSRVELTRNKLGAAGRSAIVECCSASIDFRRSSLDTAPEKMGPTRDERRKT